MVRRMQSTVRRPLGFRGLRRRRVNRGIGTRVSSWPAGEKTMAESLSESCMSLRSDALAVWREGRLRQQIVFAVPGIGSPAVVTK